MRFVRFTGGPLAGETDRADPRDSLRGPIGCPVQDPSGEYIATTVAGDTYEFTWRPKAAV